jgi:acetyl-CoA C-acetyltransferase
VQAGADDLIVAGGVESVSRVPMFSDGAPLWTDADVIRRVGSIHMGVAGDLVATLEGFAREELDAYGVLTQQRAASAWGEGRFARSLVPATDDAGKVVLDHDEHVRTDATIERLAAMEPAFAELGADGQDALALARHPELERIEHLHTRGTSPSLADAAGLVLVGSLEAAERLGLAPRARIVSTAVRSVDPVTMLTAGQLAVEDALARAKLTPDDVDLFEFAEAFAALCLKFRRDLGVGPDRFNVNGGTIAMGHAFGATGAILLATLVDELERREGRYGVVAVSGAAGLGVGAVVERVA